MVEALSVKHDRASGFLWSYHVFYYTWKTSFWASSLCSLDILNFASIWTIYWRCEMVDSSLLIIVKALKKENKCLSMSLVSKAHIIVVSVHFKNHRASSGKKW